MYESNAISGIYLPSDFPKPEGFDFKKFRVAYEESRNNVVVTIPALLTWTRDCITPETDEATQQKKWSLSLAIEKGEGDAFIKEVRSACDLMMKADGAKGAYPHCIKDGAAKDAEGVYLRSGGRLEHYFYCNAKTKNAPKVLVREDGDLITKLDTSEVIAGTYALVAGTIIAVSYGEGGKRGTSLWFNKILLCGGGKPLGGSSRSDDDDFGSLVQSEAGAASFF